MGKYLIVVLLPQSRVVRTFWGIIMITLKIEEELAHFRCFFSNQDILKHQLSF